MIIVGQRKTQMPIFLVLIIEALYYSDSTSNFPIKEKWFSIDIFDGGLTISIDENKEKSLRELFVGLQSGNCFDGILIEQLK